VYKLIFNKLINNLFDQLVDVIIKL